MAIDGRVVGSGSRLDNLSSREYKFLKPGELQANLPTALDAKRSRPICWRFYEARAAERTAVFDLHRQVPFEGVIFLVDRGFNGDENAVLLARNGNHYVFPLGGKDARCREATSDLERDLKDQFLWQLEIQANNCRHMHMGNRGYTEEGLAELSPNTSVYVLLTIMLASERDAESVFSLHMYCWGFETYFDNFKNGQDARSFCQQDRHNEQGPSIVILILSLIHREVAGVVVTSGLGMSIGNVLMDARMVKAVKRKGS